MFPRTSRVVTDLSRTRDAKFTAIDLNFLCEGE